MSQLSRREFCKTSAFFGVGLALKDLIPACEIFAADNYAEWYNRNIANANGEVFKHTSYKWTTELTDSEIDIIKEANIKAFEDAAKKIGVSPIVLGGSYSKGAVFISLNLDDNTFNEYVMRSEESISEFFSYLGIKDVPNVTFHKLQPDTELIEPVGNNLPMYVVWKTLRRLIGKYDAFIKGKEYVYELVIEQVGVPGEMRIKYDFNFKEDGIYVKEFGIDAPLLSLSNNVVDSYTSPPAETLHYAVKNTKAKGMEEDLNKMWIGLGRPRGFSIDKLLIIKDEWLKREEGVVHAILDRFVEEKRLELGFSDEQIKAYQTHGNIEGYAYIPIMREKLKHLKPQQLLQMYLKNPYELFKP